jgi:uncharacterized protein YihD (DUF1040 family)
MRDPNRIYSILRLLETAWALNPDLRLGQIFEILKSYSGKEDLFYIEDEDLGQLIKEYFNLEVKYE